LRCHAFDKRDGGLFGRAIISGCQGIRGTAIAAGKRKGRSERENRQVMPDHVPHRTGPLKIRTRPGNGCGFAQ